RLAAHVLRRAGSRAGLVRHARDLRVRGRGGVDRKLHDQLHLAAGHRRHAGSARCRIRVAVLGWRDDRPLRGIGVADAHRCTQAAVRFRHRGGTPGADHDADAWPRGDVERDRDRPVQLDHVPQHFHAGHRKVRAAGRQGFQPAGDGDRGRCRDPAGAGCTGRPHRRAPRLRAAAAVLRLHRVLQRPGVARRMNGTVYCFGEALIDFHAEARSDCALPAFIPHAGGAPANVAVAVARLGDASAFVGMFGQDVFGDLLLRGLADAGVDTRHTRRTDAANTALAFVTHDAQGERSFSFYRPPSADLLFRDDDFDPAIFALGNIFHAGSCSMTETASAATTLQGMTHAREAGALVSFDMNLRPALWPRGEDPAPTIWRALALADFVKLSAEELTFLAASTGSEAAVFERLWSASTQFVVVTDGERALRWFTR